MTDPAWRHCREQHSGHFFHALVLTFKDMYSTPYTLVITDNVWVRQLDGHAHCSLTLNHIANFFLVNQLSIINMNHHYQMLMIERTWCVHNSRLIHECPKFLIHVWIKVRSEPCLDEAKAINQASNPGFGVHGDR